MAFKIKGLTQVIHTQISPELWPESPHLLQAVWLWPSRCYYVIISPYWRFNSYSFSYPQLTVSKSIWWKIPKLNIFFALNCVMLQKDEMSPHPPLSGSATPEMWRTLGWHIPRHTLSTHRTAAVLATRTTSVALQYLCPCNIITMPKSSTTFCSILLTLYHHISNQGYT